MDKIYSQVGRNNVQIICFEFINFLKEEALHYYTISIEI